MSDNNKVVIIGAGLTGLVTGYYLKKRNIPFVILERKDRVGGVINTYRQKGFVFEEGPNSGVVGNKEVVELFEDLKEDIDVEPANSVSKARWILKNGKWHALPSGLISAVTTPLFTLKDKFGILGEPFRKPGTNPNETLADMVRRRMGKSFLDYAIDPFILGIYSGDPARLVPRFALPKLYNLEQKYGSFIGGAIKKKRDKTAENDKRVTKDIFSIRGGLSNLTKALYTYIGIDNIVLDCNNVSVTRDNENYNISYNKDGNTENIKAGKVISTVGGYALPDIFKCIGKKSLQPITNLQYAQVAQVVVGFQQWKGASLKAFGGLIPHKERRNILGVLFLSSLFKRRSPEGGALLSFFVGGVRNHKLALADNETIKEIVQKELEELFNLPEWNPRIFKVYRHPYAIPQYYADTEQRYECINNLQQQFPGIILAGNIRDGIGMADRIKQAKEIAYSI